MTHSIIGFALCLALCASLTSCRKKAPVPAPVPPPPPPPAFEPQGLWLSIQADPDLNQYEAMPHALRVVLYQLSSTNAFNTLAKDAVGFQTLLKGAIFDPSVASADPIFLQPGEDQRLPLDRAQNGKWLAVAAGYYGWAPGAGTRILELPVTPLSKAVPRREIELRFGRDAIRSAGLKLPALMVRR
jgi:type VI secretion system VasD/TssJ family lipoprotein